MGKQVAAEFPRELSESGLKTKLELGYIDAGALNEHKRV